MPDVNREPALPWGTASPSAPPAKPERLSFEETIRKVVLAAAVDLHDRGDIGRPAKRPRTDGDSCSPTAAGGGVEDAGGATLAASLVAPFVQHLGQAEPVKLIAEQRIEVKWQLDREDGAEPKWWGATLLKETAMPASTEGTTGGAATAEGSAGASPAEVPAKPASAAKAAVWLMRYDAFDGFDEEEKEAAFITDHVLAHTDDPEEMMAWRKEGEEYEPTEDSDDSDEECNDSRVVATSAEGSKTTAAELREYGGSLEHAALQRMASVPAAAQQHIAAKLSEYTAKLTATLKQLIEDKGAEGAQASITGDDMRQALARMQ